MALAKHSVEVLALIFGGEGIMERTLRILAVETELVQFFSATRARPAFAR